MALTKKDQALMAAMRDEVLLAKAFRWTPPVPRTVLKPEGLNDTRGWDFNVHSVRVYPAWSSCVSHGEGDSPSGRRGAKDLFATKRLALMALRHELEKGFAMTLAGIDKLIEEAE